MVYELNELLKSDIAQNLRGVDGGKLARLNAFVRSPGMQAVIVYRLGHWILGKGKIVRLFLQPIYIFLNHRVKSNWGIDIDRRATIGPGLYIPHYGGIFVGDQNIIGRDCLIAHDVTIGLSERGSQMGCPIIGDDVAIGPGAKIVGPIRIGNNVRIGPNAYVSRDVPDNARVALESTRSVIFPGP